MTTPTYEVFLEDALSLRVPAPAIPRADIHEGLTAIEGPRRMSLVSRRSLVSHVTRSRLEALDLAALTPPTPIFGPPRIIHRKATDTRPELVSLVCPVENSAELQAFVKEIFDSIGLCSPEPRFVFHLTLANNAGGHPRGSIAYLNRSDFVGPDLFAGKSFTPRPYPPVAGEVAKPDDGSSSPPTTSSRPSRPGA